jgi:hypothetical protein
VDAPFNAVCTALFLLAVCHTFIAPRFTEAANRMTPGATARVLHLLGEVELVFALWAVPLAVAMVTMRGWTASARYFGGLTVTEPLFVVVIMAIASTRPVVELTEQILRRIASLGGSTPAAWWLSILIVAPLLGSFVTEPGAMTIAALLLSRQFYARQPSRRLKYATLGLLFVNVSIGGTLTHFAAPPVLMVARPWGWDTPYMLSQFGWRAALAIVIATLAYYVVFRREFQALAARPAPRDDMPLATPWWVMLVSVAFLVWTVVNAHHPHMFLAGFLVFLLFDRATASSSAIAHLRTPLLVGLFLAGLVVHGTLQEWWIAPLLATLTETPLFIGATFLTAFNDNALITYLATLVPDLDPQLKVAVVQGAVTGGGLTVIANAPNPAGQALLARFFDGAVHPLWLFAGAALPTIVAAAVFRLI